MSYSHLQYNFLSDEIIEIVQGQIKPSKDDKKSAQNIDISSLYI